MPRLLPILFSYEWRALAEALQRDACRELRHAESGSEWSDWHGHNARLSRRLLDLVESSEPEDAARPLACRHVQPPA